LIGDPVAIFYANTVSSVNNKWTGQFGYPEVSDKNLGFTANWLEKKTVSTINLRQILLFCLR